MVVVMCIFIGAWVSVTGLISYNRLKKEYGDK